MRLRNSRHRRRESKCARRAAGFPDGESDARRFSAAACRWGTISIGALLAAILASSTDSSNDAEVPVAHADHAGRDRTLSPVRTERCDFDRARSASAVRPRGQAKSGPGILFAAGLVAGEALMGVANGALVTAGVRLPLF